MLLRYRITFLSYADQLLFSFFSGKWCSAVKADKLHECQADLNDSQKSEANDSQKSEVPCNIMLQTLGKHNFGAQFACFLSNHAEAFAVGIGDLESKGHISTFTLSLAETKRNAASILAYVRP